MLAGGHVPHLPRVLLDVHHHGETVGGHRPCRTCVTRKMMSWREEPSSVFDADIEEGRLKLADGQHPLNRGRSGEICLLYTSDAADDL